MNCEIVLADDQTLFREGFRMLLADVPEVHVISTVDSGAQALEVVEISCPDVLVLEPLLETPTASDVVASLSNRGMRCLVLTSSAEDWLVHQMLQRGAYGCLTKDESVERIVEALCGIKRGEAGWLSRPFRQSVYDPQTTTIRTARQCLTDREWEVLIEIIFGSENREIANRLCISPGTVRNHVSRILDKIGVPNRKKLMVWGFRRGLFRAAVSDRSGT